MRISGSWARLLFLGLVMALVGLLGVAPVGAQDESGSAEDAAGEAADDGSGAELLAKALELARSIEAGDAAQPPVRVESRQHSVIYQEGETAGGLAPAPMDLRHVLLVDSKGNSWMGFADPQYLGDDLLKVSEEYREYLSQRSQTPEYIEVDGVVYEPHDQIALRYYTGEDSSPDTPWVSRVLSDVVDTQSDSATKFLNVFFGGSAPDPLSVFPGTVGGARYTANLLGHSVSATSVGQATIRGHDTTELLVSISAADLLWVNIRDMIDALTSSIYLDVPFVLPSEALISEIFAADNLVEFRIWIDESGRVHRLISDYSEIFSSYVEFAFGDILDLEPGDLQHTTNSEFMYLDEDPVIVAPAADEVHPIESISSYLADLRAAAAEGAGDELADTGANTLLWVIAGISVVLAGAMVLALSRRLRIQQIR